MIGVDKKPLKISFRLLIVSIFLSVLYYVLMLAKTFEYTAYWLTTVIEFTEMLGLLVAPVCLCIHMKLQQRCKTDFLFPLAFCNILVTNAMLLIVRIWEFISWFYSSQLLSIVLPLVQVLLMAMVVLEYFVIKKPIVSVVALFVLLAYSIYSFVDLIVYINWYFEAGEIRSFFYLLARTISLCLMYIACIIYTFLRIKYVKTLKHAPFEEKEQMLRVLKMQHDERKFSDRQYARRKKEILKYL